MAVHRGVELQLVLEHGARGGFVSHTAAALAHSSVAACVVKRRRSAGIQHNKFLVLARDGVAVAVWTGSTNLSDSGIKGHANGAHCSRHGVRGSAASGVNTIHLMSTPCQCGVLSAHCHRHVTRVLILLVGW